MYRALTYQVQALEQQLAQEKEAAGVGAQVAEFEDLLHKGERRVQTGTEGGIVNMLYGTASMTSRHPPQDIWVRLPGQSSA